MTFLVTVFERCGSGNKEPVRLCKKKKKKKKKILLARPVLVTFEPNFSSPAVQFTFV
jgi:hypothetical protein